MEDLTHLSLFTGIAGVDIAAEWAGFETVCFVENNEYCQKVLRKHWPDLPIIGDIKDVTKEKVMAHAESHREGGRQSENRPGKRIKQRSESAGRSLVSNKYNPITLITGGFPCQPVSVAGKRKGKEDDRWLWPEMFRVIREVRPAWVVAENVAGLIRMGLNDCLLDLENEGYSTQTFLIPACAVNAPHRRDRVFIVAYSTKCIGQPSSTQSGERNTEGCGKDAPDTPGKRLENRTGLQPGEQGAFPTVTSYDNWTVEPDVGRVASRVPARVDRLKALGNAVVPQQIYPILKAIADIERGKRSD